MDKLFTLLYRLSDGSRLKIDALHTGQYESRGTAKITIEAIHFIPDPKFKKPIRRVLWKPNQTWCSPSPLHTEDGKETRKLITTLVSSPDFGDADSNREQLDFAMKYGEDLDCQAMCRYGED